MTPPRSGPRRWARIAAALTAAVALGTAAIGGTFAAFTSIAHNTGNEITAADFRAPAVETAVIARSGGSVPGFVRQAGAYHVYARVAADRGDPATGTATVTADVSAVTVAGSTVPLLAGSYSIGGASYNYRSAALVADAVLSEGARSYSVTATDSASNASTLAGLSVVVDNSAPTAADVQTADAGGGTVGRPQPGDTLTLSFSEPIDPATILDGWDGDSTNVVVRMTNGGLLGLLANDDVEIRNAANTAPLPLGRVDLGRGDYIGGLLGGETVSFGAGGTASTMAMNGDDVTVTLGSAGSGSVGTATGNGTASWPPSATPTDRAGNLSSLAAANESGAADKEF